MKKISILAFLLFTSIYSSNLQAQEPFIGEIRMVGFNFAPRGWAFCYGQLLNISQNTALFSLLGTTYGGDGIRTFALPDLRGRVPMGEGNAPGLSVRQLGEMGGTETNTLRVDQLPPHSHTVNAVTTVGNNNIPSGNLLADTKLLDKEYSSASPNTTMNPNMVNLTGGGQAINNVQPFTTMNFIIALEGIYPSRP